MIEIRCRKFINSFLFIQDFKLWYKTAIYIVFEVRSVSNFEICRSSWWVVISLFFYQTPSWPSFAWQRGLWSPTQLGHLFTFHPMDHYTINLTFKIKLFIFKETFTLNEHEIEVWNQTEKENQSTRKIYYHAGFIIHLTLKLFNI